MKVEKAMESVNRVARRSNEPGLRRVSQDLNLVRNSIKLARASMGTTGGCTCGMFPGRKVLLWYKAFQLSHAMACVFCRGG